MLFLFFYRSHVRKELWKSGGLVGAHGRRWYEVGSHLIIVRHKNFENIFSPKEVESLILILCAILLSQILLIGNFNDLDFRSGAEYNKI